MVEGIDTLILVQCTSRKGKKEGEGEVKVERRGKEAKGSGKLSEGWEA